MSCIYYSTVNITTYIIRIIAFHLSRIHRVPIQNPVPEAGGEPFDLLLNNLGSIEC